MSSAELVVVRTFNDRIEADLAHSALEAAGIESMVGGDDAGGIQPGLWTGEGVRVLVKEDDVAAARDVLDLPATPAE